MKQHILTLALILVGAGPVVGQEQDPTRRILSASLDWFVEKHAHLLDRETRPALVIMTQSTPVRARIDGRGVRADPVTLPVEAGPAARRSVREWLLCSPPRPAGLMDFCGAAMPLMAVFFSQPAITSRTAVVEMGSVFYWDHGQDGSVEYRLSLSLTSGGWRVERAVVIGEG